MQYQSSEFIYGLFDFLFISKILAPKCSFWRKLLISSALKVLPVNICAIMSVERWDIRMPKLSLFNIALNMLQVSSILIGFLSS